MKLFQVDAFTEIPFAGNPAGVCLLEREMPDSWMQAVAAEMNLAETAFIRRDAGGWTLRWFTPLVEVDLCGHATLASAHVLWETGVAPDDDEIRFQTRSGILSARRSGKRIELDFPSEPPLETAADFDFGAPQRNDTDAALLSALRVEDAEWIGRNRMDYLVQLADSDAVRTLAPDLAALRTIDTRGVIVTARDESEEYDFVSRFFCPAIGIDEDPVTGSAHCALAPFWSERLQKSVMTGYQASPRGGTVEVELRGERVALRGEAITVFRGELLA